MSGQRLSSLADNARQTLVEAIRLLIRQQGEKLMGAFVVVGPGYVRINPKK